MAAALASAFGRAGENKPGELGKAEIAASSSAQQHTQELASSSTQNCPLHKSQAKTKDQQESSRSLWRKARVEQGRTTHVVRKKGGKHRQFHQEQFRRQG